MENFYTFFQFLNKFIHLDNDEYNRIIKPHLETRQFNKKEIISVAGEVEDYFNFITTGLVRKYFVIANVEINIQISTENQIIHAQESFYNRTPSEYTIEAIEATTLVSLSHASMEKIFSASAKMERLGRLIVTHFFMLRDKWQMQMIKLSPRERFLDFVVKNPDLLQRVPQKYLASYLSIQPETFSRFKHMLREVK